MAEKLTLKDALLGRGPLVQAKKKELKERQARREKETGRKQPF